MLLIKNIDRNDFHMRLNSVQYHINLINRRYQSCPERLRDARYEVLAALKLRKVDLLENIHNEEFKFQAQPAI